MKKRSVIFKQPFVIDVEEQDIPKPKADELLVANRLSAISAGTEMLVFKGHFPADMALDEKIPSLSQPFQYPLKYGYSCVGEVIATGARPTADWMGRQVFAFHPHESHFIARPEDVIPLPDGVPVEDAVFLAGMETAVNVVMDGRPMLGERVIVLGLGVIGLLTTAVLSRFPLGILIGVDRMPLRREAGAELGADIILSGNEDNAADTLSSALASPDGDGRADLIFELSGDPDALNTALDWSGYQTRLVIGSWYGTKPATVALGGRFHRNRIAMTSSQVSTVAPALSGRWTHKRRMAVAWKMVTHCRPGKLVTHRFDVRGAQDAYEMIAEQPQHALQVVLTYG